jgi:hypothetical protein
MNEPILAGAKKKETDWLAGDFVGKHLEGHRTRKRYNAE